MLARQAPALPLPGCSDPGACRCQYRKYADRRTEERRLPGGTGRFYPGAEKRSWKPRRRTD